MEAFPIPREVLLALKQLNAAGYEAFCVGGCVRDTLLGRSPTDWDVTTDARPEQIKTCFAEYRLLETGIEFGTVTVLVEKMPLEVTTYRADGAYLDHRHPKEVSFSSQLEDDLARRDFTVNAMAYHPEQGLVDVFGGGDDLRAEILRCVGDPKRRFEEDALRILRCLRFASELGFSIEEETAAVLREKRESLSSISRERVQSCLLRLLCGTHAEQVLRAYPEVLLPLLPQLLPMSKRRVRYLLDTLGEQCFFALLDQTEQQGGEVENVRSAAKKIIAQKNAVPLAITGRELLALGIPAGPELGMMLEYLSDMVRDGKIENEQSALLKTSKEIIKKAPCE